MKTIAQIESEIEARMEDHGFSERSSATESLRRLILVDGEPANRVSEVRDVLRGRGWNV